MKKLITKIENSAAERYLVYDQEWTPEALEELRQEHGVFFRADSAVAVRVRGRILSLGIEDDGAICFGPESPSFHVRFAPALAGLLQDAADALLPPPLPEPERE